MDATAISVLMLGALVVVGIVLVVLYIASGEGLGA